jgi:methylthioribose-1-phosphate isomerase
MKINNHPTRTLVESGNDRSIEIIDQTALPHHLRTLRLANLEDAARAIRTMQVRGAPLIGVTAAYGLAMALLRGSEDADLSKAVSELAATRPTAVNLHWALDRLSRLLLPLPPDARADAAWREAGRIAEEDIEQCRRIGENGLALLRPLAVARGKLEVMTHCNAGWLATVDFGTALAPVYAAFDSGIAVHVWVSETRPRNQGLLTAWELRQHGVPHTLIADNAAACIMARDQVEFGLPFYVAAPRSTIDFSCPDGAHIPIEERGSDELRVVHGLNDSGRTSSVRQIPADEAVVNPAFDLTPARLISTLITERGCCQASSEGLRALYPEATHA